MLQHKWERLWIRALFFEHFDGLELRNTFYIITKFSDRSTHKKYIYYAQDTLYILYSIFILFMVFFCIFPLEKKKWSQPTELTSCLNNGSQVAIWKPWAYRHLNCSSKLITALSVVYLVPTAADSGVNDVPKAKGLDVPTHSFSPSSWQYGSSARNHISQACCKEMGDHVTKCHR